MSRCDHTLLGGGPRCCAEAGHDGQHRYKCAGPHCPGLTYPAHVLAHPASCVEPLRHITTEEMADAIERGDYELPAVGSRDLEGESAMLGVVLSEENCREAEEDAKLGRAALDSGDPLELAAAVDAIAGAAIERHRRRFTIGTRVKALRGFSGVPINTEGIVDEHYTAGVMVAWDLEDRPLREDYAELIRGGLKPLPQAALGAPLRDGFSYGELIYLEVLEAPGAAGEERQDG
jgi:hypothetical protein